MNRERITVCVAGEGRHLFETIRDTRIALIPVDGADTPDLIVLPCGQDRRFERLGQLVLPERLLLRIANGASGVVLDASPEAIPPKPDIIASLHDVIRRLGLPTRRCVYVTANWYFAQEYMDFCRHAGIPDPVRILQHDYWVWRSFSGIADDGERVHAERLAAFRARRRTRSRRFLSLNRTPRPFKIMLLLSLLRDGLWDSGFISFGGFGEDGKSGKPCPTADQLAAAMPGFEDMARDLARWLETLEGYGCVLLGRERAGSKPLKQEQATAAEALSEYNDSWFSVVTETEMLPKPLRITEKVLKPLVNFHPFIVFGNPGSLQRVREYGFATFDDIIDESYDEESNPRGRFDRAYAELVRLSQLGEHELDALESATSDRLIYNARWGLTRFPSVYRAQRDVALVNEILSYCFSTAM